VNSALELILWGFIAYLLWRILRVVSGGRDIGAAPAIRRGETGQSFRSRAQRDRRPADSNASRPPLPTGSTLAATVTDDSPDEPYTIDDDFWEDGGSHTELYPSQRKFLYKSWWIPGDMEQEYEYRVDPDCHLMCRLRSSAETGTKSGEGSFDDRFYQDLHTVRDGVVIEDAVRFTYEDHLITRSSERIMELSAKTEWHEITYATWPGLWYNVIKIHIGEYEARRGIRKELERLKRGLRIITEQTSQWFTFEHDEKFKVSTFKPIDESTSESERATILADALERSGLTLSEAQVGHFQMRSLATLLGDATEGNHESGAK